MVEWKPLNKLVSSISTGLNPRTNFVLNENDAYLFYVTVKEITSNKIVFSESTDRITPSAKEIINKRSKLEKGDILFSGIGTIGKVAYVNINTDNWDCSESVFLIKPAGADIKGKFLYYILTSDIAKRQYEKGSAGAIMKGVRKKTLESIQIPIPSLAEQNRIVGILDTFTDSIENLKQQIAQRRKQYEFYRDQLLDLEGKEGVEMKTLGEISEIRGRIGFRGYTRNDQVAKGEGALTLTATNIVNQKINYDNNTYITWAKYNESPEIMVKNDDIIICQRGSIGKVAIVENLIEPATINPQLLLLKNIKCNNRYLIHYLRSKTFQDKLSKIIGFGTIQMIAQKDLKLLQVPIIIEFQQQRIVSILDTFEASISNLEAQLEQRQKQYEYYRNQLLTFE